MVAVVFDRLLSKTASCSRLEKTEVLEDVALGGSVVGGIVSA